MAVERLARVKPIYALGNSHCLIYDGLLFERSGQRFAFRAKYCPLMGSANFFERGELSEAVLAALRSEGLDEPDNARDATLVVFALGFDYESSALWIGEQQVIMEGLPPSPFPDTDRPIFPASLAADLVAVSIAPLMFGLLRLADLGFQVFVHGGPPPRPDAAYSRLRRFHGPSPHTAYRAVVLANAALAAFSQVNPAIGLLDTWEATTKDGVRDERFALDADHLNRSWAKLVGEMLLDRLEWGNPPAAPAPPLLLRAARRVLEGGPENAFIAETRRRFGTIDWDSWMRAWVTSLDADLDAARGEAAQAEAQATEALERLEMRNDLSPG